jgi:hypothetical protein
MSRPMPADGLVYDVAPIGVFAALIIADPLLDGTAGDYDLALTARLAEQQRTTAFTRTICSGSHQYTGLALNPELASVLPDQSVSAVHVPPGAWDLTVQPAGTETHSRFVVAALMPQGPAGPQPRWLAAGLTGTAVMAAAVQWSASANSVAMRYRISGPAHHPASPAPAVFPELDLAAAAARATTGRQGAAAAAFPRPGSARTTPPAPILAPRTVAPPTRGPHR